MRPITRRGLLAAAVLLSGGRLWLRPAVAEVLFKADFETGDFSQFRGFSRGAKPGHAAVVTDVVHSGKYAGRFMDYVHSPEGKHIKDAAEAAPQGA